MFARIAYLPSIMHKFSFKANESDSFALKLKYLASIPAPEHRIHLYQRFVEWVYLLLCIVQNGPVSQRWLEFYLGDTNLFPHKEDTCKPRKDQSKRFNQVEIT